MTRVVTRLVLTFVMVPICLFSMIMASIVIDDLTRWDDDVSVPFVCGGGMLLYAALFLLVWRKTTPWTPARVQRVALAFAVSVASSTFAVFLLHSVDISGGEESAYSTLVIMLAGGGLVCWLALILQESPKERLARLGTPGARARTCPLCKYDLSGLSNLKCPECGQTYTLAQLLDEHERAAVPRGLE